MSLAVAVPLGVASSIVYGTSIVIQHRATHTGGTEDARGLLRLLRDPRWLMAIAGDFVGFLLNIAALATGPVVVIQPLVVLMLPVALVVGYLMGGPRPKTVDYLSSVAILGGLGTFLALIGRPGDGHVPRARWIALAILIVLVLGLILSVSVIKRGPSLRGAMYGVSAGLYFGALGVMVDGASGVVAGDHHHGSHHSGAPPGSNGSSGAATHDVVHESIKHGFTALVTTGRGLVPLIGIVLLGLGGIVLTQISFQIGHLGATLPANLVADPFTAVVIGALLLREHLPLSAGHLVLYALCLAAVIVGAIQLAKNATAPVPPDATSVPARLSE